MGDKSSIEWTEATWNPVAGCSIVSPGCTNCYAMKMAARIEAMSAKERRATHYDGLTKPSKAGAVWTGKMAVAPEHILTLPLRWKRPRRIFVNSMSDLFHEDVAEETIDRVFAVMALAPHHTFQVLTKRASRMRGYMAGNAVRDSAMAAGSPWPLPNVWLGVSAEDQRRADERVPLLLGTPAAVRWVSAEPLLGPLDLARYLPCTVCRDRGYIIQNPFAVYGVRAEPCARCRHAAEAEGKIIEPGGFARKIGALNWIVAGGESGPGARPPHPDWFRSLRDQCAAAGVPYFFKQWGAFAPESDCAPGSATFSVVTQCGRHLEGEAAIAGEVGGAVMGRVGKKAAGATLDGVTHKAWPK